jgi:CarD family transcriptional regulator
VSQKTRKKSVSKGSKKAAAAIGRGATKGRARTSLKDTRKATKASAAKSSKNKRSAMPNKTAKTAAKATGSKATASKVAHSKTNAKAAPKTVASKAAGPKAAAPKAAAPKAAAPKAAAHKAAVSKTVAPKAAVASKPVVAAKPAAKPVAAAPRVEEPKKPLTQRQGFKTNEFVVYPAHGVGQILAIEEQEIAGARLELFVINFMKDKMTLRVPTAKVANVGMRKLSEPALVKRALETLKGRARVKRTMWSRRAQEYEAKINSGDIVAIAEVVRDLYRSESQPEQSYSERQLYEAALDRLSREIAVVQHVTETEAVKEIESQLAKSPRRGAKAETEVGADGEADADTDADGDDAAVADEAA